MYNENGAAYGYNILPLFGFGRNGEEEEKERRGCISQFSNGWSLLWPTDAGWMKKKKARVCGWVWSAHLSTPNCFIWIRMAFRWSFIQLFLIPMQCYSINVDWASCFESRVDICIYVNSGNAAIHLLIRSRANRKKCSWRHSYYSPGITAVKRNTINFMRETHKFSSKYNPFDTQQPFNWINSRITGALLIIIIQILLNCLSSNQIWRKLAHHR